MREQWEAGGFKVYNIGSGVGPSGSLHNMPEVTLNLPGRDQKIEEYLNYIRYLGKAGIPYSTYAHMGNGIWSSGSVMSPRGYEQGLRLKSPNLMGSWGGKTYKEPLSHGRPYTKEEIWDNYTYFIKKVVPVAEEAGVRIGIHPDDPPQPVLAGVPRCIFGNFEGYKKGLGDRQQSQHGHVPVRGVLAGGRASHGQGCGRDHQVLRREEEAIQGSLPERDRASSAFHRELVGRRLLRRAKVMKALVDVNFEGIAIPDHIPGVGSIPSPGQPAGQRGGRGGGAAGGFRASAGQAYLLAYMNALLKTAQSNKGKA